MFPQCFPVFHAGNTVFQCQFLLGLSKGNARVEISPALKDEERFRNGLVRKPYERSLCERTFMSEPFIEKHVISTELCNVNREKHKLKSRVCRRDREPSRIPIRSLKSLRNKSRKVRICLCTYSFVFSHVIYIVLLCKCKKYISQIRCYVTIYAICCETTSNKTRVSPKHKARVNANMRLVFFRSATVCNSLINTHARRFY